MNWKEYQKELKKVWDKAPDDLGYLYGLAANMDNPEYRKERKRRIQSLRNIGMSDLANELEEMDKEYD